MRIVVIGAGEVGSYVSGLLSREGVDVAVIERDPARLTDLEKHEDVLGVLGNGCHPDTLQRAGIEQADLLVAVTKSDATNLLACLVAKTEFHVRKTIARIESPKLRSENARRIQRAAGADQIIDPDEATARDIFGLLAYPGATEVAYLANGEVMLLGAKVSADAPIVGRRLEEIGDEYSKDGAEWDFIVATVRREGQTVVARKNHTIVEGDTLRVICRRKASRKVSELLGIPRGSHRRIMLLGGGRTAEILAGRLVERHAEVTLVERNPLRAQELAETLEGVLILQGDITDAELLQSENVGSQDAVIALTGQDDANVLACLFAKSMGAAETIAVLHRLELQGLLGEVGIDAAISPRTASANAVLRHVRGNVTQVATSLTSDIEVFEIEVESRSEADGACLADLHLPSETLIAAIIRDGDTEIGRRWSTLKSRDHVVAVARPEQVADVRGLLTRSR